MNLKEDLEKKKKRLEEFHFRNKEFQKKKDEQIKDIIQSREKPNTSKKNSSFIEVDIMVRAV